MAEYPPDDSAKPFDPKASFEEAKKGYSAMGKRLKLAGEDPGEFEGKAWKGANEMFDRVAKLARAYPKAKAAKSKDRIENAMTRQVEDLNSVRRERVYAEAAAAEKEQTRFTPEEREQVISDTLQNIDALSPAGQEQHVDIDLDAGLETGADVEALKASLQQEAQQQVAERTADNTEALKKGESINDPKSSALNRAIAQGQARLDARQAPAKSEPATLPTQESAGQTPTFDIDKANAEGPAVWRKSEEMTRKEAQEELQRLVAEATAKADAEKETKQEKEPATPGEMLAVRSQELDAGLAKMGKVESGFRRLGEKYNKMGWKTKIAVGLTLGVGAGIASGASLPAAFACLTGVAAQRVAGLSTAFLKFEKSELEKGGTHAKEKAMVKAILFSAGMTLAMSELIREVSQSDWAAHVREWLGDKLGHHAAAPMASQTSEAPTLAPHASSVPDATPPPAPPEVPQAAATAAPAAEAAPAVAAPAPIAEAPVVSVGASSHGYEGMLKDLIKQLPDQPPAGMQANSDIERLFDAKAHPEKINGVIHRLAMDHKFFGEGGSVVIDKSAHLSIGADGALHFSDAAHGDIVNAAEGMKLSGAPHIEAPVPSAPVPEDAHIEAQPPPSVETNDLTAAQEAHEAAVNAANVPTPAPALAPEAPVVHDGSGNAIRDGSGNLIHSGSYEQAADVVRNNYGLDVPVKETHLYIDSAGTKVFAFGGTAEARLEVMTKYLTTHPNEVIYAADDSGKYRVAWGVVDGRLISGAPIKNTGITSFFSAFAKPPELDDFARLIR